MRTRDFTTLTEHIAALIRQGMAEGRWRDTVPGRDRLAEELGCSHWTVEEALRRLTEHGELVSQGAGRRRKIVSAGPETRARALRVAILLYEPSDRKTDYLVELVHRLREAGHDAFFCEKSTHEPGMDLRRVCRMVEGTKVDAWVVVAGSRDLLEWIAGRETPAFALFGRHRQVNIAGSTPNKGPAYMEIVDRLVAMGHRRMVNIVREDRRKPSPGFLDRLFLEQLGKHGIPTGDYNLPDWEDSPQGLRAMLDSLLRTTPPTALLLDEPMLFIAARDHLARKGMVAPEHVSLVCCDASPVFDWCHPQVSHIRWDPRPIVRRVVRWADRIGCGKDDRRKSANRACFVPGGTIGPVPNPGGS